jgi:DNA-binding response OmpR family regulator
MRILLVEDDPMIGESVREGLRQELYTVDWVCDGQAAEDALARYAYDLMLLDLGLPKKDGLDLLAQYRRRGGQIPVLVTTARGEVVDRIRGLDYGADDYLVKPFDIDEMYARVRALLRRRPKALAATQHPVAARAGGSSLAPPASGILPPHPSQATWPRPAAPGSGLGPGNLRSGIDPTGPAAARAAPSAAAASAAAIEYRGLVLRPATGEISFKGSPLRLSGREYAVLRALLDPPGCVVSRARLESLLVQADPGSHGTLERDVQMLRSKFGNDFIRSLSGSGFMIAPPH